MAGQVDAAQSWVVRNQASRRALRSRLEATIPSVALCGVLLLGVLASAHAEPLRAEAHGEFARVARSIGAHPDRYVVEENVMVAMRDGVRLSTSLLYPRDGGPAPTLLLRTPYDMSAELGHKTIFPKLIENGYAIVMQNERGVHWSEGEFKFLGGARNDGYDTLSWIASRPWSNGKVGTFGCSSGAENQLALGAMKHPAHRAMISLSPGAGVGAIPGVSSQGAFYRNGVPLLATWMNWYSYYGHKYRVKLPVGLDQEEINRIATVYSPDPIRIINKYRDFESVLNESARQLPSRDVLRRAGVPHTDFDTLITLTPTDPKWSEYDFITARDTGAVPTLHINAWGDYVPYETLKLFEFQSHHPDQYLIMAPTAHCDMMKATENTMIGDRAVGDGRLDYDNLYLRWLDQQLKGRDRAFSGVPKVQVFLWGGNRWLTGDRWPFQETKETKLFLSSGGRANSLYGDGVLASQPASAQQPDQFVSDPANPVPSKGGGCCDRRVVRDQSDVESRHDVLVYSTAPFKEGVSIVGELRAVLYVSTTAKDGDIALKLVDVYPDGTAYNLTDTIFRLRYRDGFDAPRPTQAGEIYRVEITGLVTSNYFAPGHRLRLEVAGSNFPNYERNLNTGGNNYDETAGVVGRVTIHHDAARPSHLELPIYRGQQTADLK